MFLIPILINTIFVPIAALASLGYLYTGPMTCNPSPGEETVDEGDNVDVACIVEYAGYEAPILNWAEMTASPGESNDTHSK